MDPKADNAESPTSAKNTSLSCSCGKKLSVKAELAGKKVKCPGCQQILTVPASEATRAFQESLSVRDPSQATIGEVPGVDKDLCSFLAPPEGPDELGRLGGYRVVKILGHGGMGVVFKAEDVQLRRFVALKAMLPKLATNATAKDRFFREARSAAALKHDHIVAIHQVGEDRGAPFLAMEFLEGESLDDRLKREGRLTIAEVTRIGREVAEGLAAAHERNFIHRDIKPANIWLEGKKSRAKILDFGLARGMSDDLHLTQSGMMIGTPAYMPTEQASGGDVDQRCDLYSLGVMLYRMSTGGMPFKGKDAISLLSSLALDTPAEPSSINPDIPPELNDLILQLLSKNRDDRPATATEVAQSLASVPLSTSGELPTPGPIHAFTTKPPVKRSPGTVDIRRPETVRPPRRRGPMIAVAIAFLIVAMVAGGMVMFRPTPIGKLPDGNRAIEPIEKPLAKTFTNSIGMEFVLVPAGKFLMGSPPEEKEREPEEVQHEVEITKGFWLGKYEVTQEEYEKVMGSNRSQFKGPKLPVEQVSWNDAKEFCKKLSAKEGKEYTLPTEAEWEYACRAGTAGPFSTGENLTTAQANYNGESPYAGNPKGLNRGKTMDLGSFASNGYGLHDMHGNVWEWCEDWQGAYDTKGVAIDPKGPPGGSNRVYRGGCWDRGARFCRSADRGGRDPTSRYGSLGFRVALRTVKTPDQVTKVEPPPAKPTPVPPAVKAGEEMTNSIGMKLVSIPPGKFLMGSPPEEREREPDEVQHEVEITKGFWLGKYEVTQEEYEKVMGSNPSVSKGPKLPVEQVSWEDAKEFCKKLSAKEGKEYTLPTEAEWEYACRAGTKGPFSTGENLTTDQANYNGESPYVGNPKGLKRGRTTEVGSFAANAFGLCDMHGNVWEWCEDWRHGAYDAKGVAIDPKGPSGGSNRVFRGGSRYTGANYCRSAFRLEREPSFRFHDLGFRVALRSVNLRTDAKPTPVPPVPPAVKAGEEMTNSLGMKLVSIPPGKFLMGSPADEKERDVGEVQHEVEITKGFWLGKYEVTQEEYEKVMGSNPSQSKGPKLPVEQVSWEDAKEFCKKLSAKEGKEYTLPTEAEWEYACRAGTKGPFSTGENLRTVQANYKGDAPYAGNPKGLNRGKTTEVGSFAANGYGLHDMHGNVGEWCEDWFGPYDTKGVAIDPKGSSKGSGRVFRGGGWISDARFCRSAYRNWFVPTLRFSSLGFRVALRSVK